MTQEVHVTEQNLTQFQNYLLKMPQPEFNPNLHFDLPLSVILRNAPNLSPAAQETLAYVIAYGKGHQNRMADVETMLDLAEKFPILLGRAYQRGDNTTSYNDYVYTNINHALQHRPFEQNIPAIYTLLHYGQVFYTGTGEIAKTSVKNTRYLNEIFRASHEYSKDPFNTYAKTFINNLPTYKLLNFETSMSEFRDYIDQRNFGNYDYRDNRQDMLSRMNPDKITEKTMAAILQSMSLWRPEHKDTTNAKTQAEKNANILPMYYTKARDALLHLAEKQEIHDSSNYGATKTLSRRYKELCAKLLNAKSWEQIDQYTKRGLIHETYITALQRDVIDGNAEKLSPDELQLVLNNDKTGFYVRKIDRKVLEQAKVRLTEKQNAIISAQNETYAKYAMDNKHLSSRDKHAVLGRLEKSVASDAARRDALNAELAQYDQDYQVVAAQGQAYQNISKAFNAVQKIQKAYENIARQFKDGKPNDRETTLTPGMLEAPIYAYISGTKRTPVNMPDEGGLPIFGRSKEKDRRDLLAHAIKVLNDALSQIASGMNSETLKIISQYKDNILNPETLSAISGIMNGARNAADSAHITFTNAHNQRPRGQIENELKILTDKQQTLTESTARFQTKKKQMRDMSKRHLGHDQEGQLIPVTDDMTPEEKHKTRAKNKAMLTDKLAARRGRKPAKNLAELLADNNER